MWIPKNEGTKFSFNILKELQNQDVKDTLTACVDSLKDFPGTVTLKYGM